MVTDFKHLNWFKNFLDDTLDHKFIMDINDPLIPHEVPELCVDNELMLLDLIPHKEGYWMPDMSTLTHLPKAVIEKYEGMVFVDFVPTSENLTTWLLEVAREKMASLGVEVTSVEFWETPKSHCKVE